MTCIKIPNGVMCVQQDFKPGDQAPEGYMAWFDWAEVQHKAGLRQKACGRCAKWQYPQQLSSTTDRSTAQSRKGLVTVLSAVCNECVALAAKAPK